MKHRDLALLARYLTGECQGRDEAEVRARLAVDESLAQTLDDLRHLWVAAEAPAPDVDVAALRRRFHERVQHELRPGEPPHPPRVIPLPSAPGPAQAARLGSRPASRRRSASPLRSFLRVAAVLVAVVAGAVLARHLVQPSPSAESEAAPHVYATEAGQLTTLRLADGTKVRLSVHSRLTVPATFGEGSRSVVLEGEAFFDVAHDPARPFRVRTGGSTVEVLGTAFDVRAYADEGVVQVVVASGRVAVRPDAVADTLVLRPRHLVRLREGRITDRRADADVERYTAWREGRLVFRGAPFAEVERELERWYDLDVELRAAPRDLRPLDATFGDEPLSEILNTIAAALDLAVTRERRHVVFGPAPGG